MSEKIEEYKVTDHRMKETEVPAVQGPYAVVMMAMQKNMSAELIGKMMDLQERFEANEARKAYHDAMSRFKANPPEIEKDKKVSFDTSKGKTGYSHASLANVTGKINKALSENGLSATWKTEQAEKGITVTCTITHRFGHSESTSLTAAPDTSGSKNAIQAVGSTITYLERYTLLALTGLATHDMDDDGNSTEIEYLTEDQQSEIKDKIKVLYPKTPEKFLKWIGYEAVDKIPSKEYKRTIGALNEIEEKAKEKKKSERTPGEEG